MGDHFCMFSFLIVFSCVLRANYHVSFWNPCMSTYWNVLLNDDESIVQLRVTVKASREHYSGTPCQSPNTMLDFTVNASSCFSTVHDAPNHVMDGLKETHQK